MNDVQVLVFDVFGTVVDWRSSIIEALGAFGRRYGVSADWAEVADRWRGRYQPSLEEVRSGRRPWVPLDVLHRESLIDVLHHHGLGHAFPADVDALNRAWHRLRPWPDTRPAFAQLARRATLVSLSNAEVAMSAAIAHHAGINWHHIMGAEPARAYKPQPEVYLHPVRTLGLQPHQVMMVAAHNRDLEAARRLGLRTAFVLRPTEHGPGQTTDLAPTGPWDVVCSDLLELASILDGGDLAAPSSDSGASHPSTRSTSGSGAEAGPSETGAPGSGEPDGWGAADLTRLRMLTVAVVLAVAVGLAYQRGYSVGLDAERAPPTASTAP